MLARLTQPLGREWVDGGGAKANEREVVVGGTTWCAANLAGENQRLRACL
jgi:hypothetical protein